MADRLTEIERRLGNLEHRVAAMQVSQKASIVAPKNDDDGGAKTPEQAVINLIRTRLRLHLRTVDLDFALSNIRSQKYDDMLLAIFCRPAR